MRARSLSLLEIISVGFSARHVVTLRYLNPQGNSHVIHDGSFYYHVKGHPNITRLDLNTREVTTVVLPDMIYSDNKFLYNNSRDYADLSADTEGLWAIYSTSYRNNTVVVRMNIQTLKVVKVLLGIFKDRDRGGGGRLGKN